MYRFLQFWGKLNTRRIMVFPQFPNHFPSFPMVFLYVSPSVSTTSLGVSTVSLQFVIFKSLGYCFEETIGFDVKTSFANRPVSGLIR